MISLRTLHTIIEIVAFFAMILLVLLLLGKINSSIVHEYQNRQLQEIIKIDILIRDFVSDNEKDLASFSELSNEQRHLLNLHRFTDLYSVDNSLIIDHIYKQGKNYLIFKDYDISYSNIGKFISTIPIGMTKCSPLMNSFENDRLSFYIIRRKINGYVIGRIELVRLLQDLRKFSAYSGNNYLLATPDGYILANAGKDLAINVLTDSTKKQLRINGIEYLINRKQSKILKNDIIVLTPFSQIRQIITSAEIIFWILMAALFVILFIKLRIQRKYIFDPLIQFTALIGKWDVVDKIPQVQKDISFEKYIEMANVYNAFIDKTEQIKALVEELKASHFEKLEQNESLF